VKITAQEEYGLRCLLTLARAPQGCSTIGEVAAAEALSPAYAAKLLALLRRAGFVKSTRGANGGQKLARPAAQINLAAVLAALSGPLFSTDFCARHPGAHDVCVHIEDCSIRSVWRSVESALQEVLRDISLADLLRPERAFATPIRIGTAERMSS
jgi:Rrf2 family protein